MRERIDDIGKKRRPGRIRQLMERCYISKRDMILGINICIAVKPDPNLNKIMEM